MANRSVYGCQLKALFAIFKTKSRNHLVVCVCVCVCVCVYASMCMCVLSCARLFATLWTVAH